MAGTAAKENLPSRLPPGPKGRLVVGNAVELAGDWMGFLSQCARDYGDAVFFRFFGTPICLLVHPDYIEHVLATNQSNFVKSRDYRVLSRVMGKGLLTAENGEWRQQRRLVQPAFNHENVIGYGRIVVQCAARMLEGWEDGDARDVHAEMTHLTLEIVTRVLFGASVLDRASDVANGLRLMMEEFTWHANLAFVLPDFAPLPVGFRLRRAIRLLDDVFESIIRERRSNPGGSDDLLGTLLNMRHENGRQMSNRELRDELMTFLLAGHETTAVALSWTWYLLALNPEVEAKLYEELDRVLGGREPNVADLPGLPYTEAVVKESMRLYPPAWGIGRKALSGFEVGKFRLPAGTNVFMMQWITHRDGRFFPEPETFRPDRWTDESTQPGNLPRFAYFPFGGGPRKCIGASFATMEAVLVLVAMAQQFRLNLAPDAKVEILPSLTLRPSKGIKMLAQRRARSAGSPKVARSVV